MENNEKGNDLRNFLLEATLNIKYLLKQWKIILACGIIGGLLGVTYAYLKKPKYESFMSFSLEENGNSLSGALNLAAEFGLNLGMSSNSIFEGENILTILKSRRIIEQVLLSSDSVTTDGKTFIEQFIDMYPLNNKLLQKYYARGVPPINFHKNKPRNTFTYLEDSIVFTVYNQISRTLLNAKKPDKRLNYYTLTFTSASEKFSKDFLDQLIKVTTNFYVELKTKRSLNTLKILEERVSAMKGNARASISSRAAIQDANLNPALNNQMAQLQSTQIDISAFSGAYAELFKNLEIARYQYLKDIPLLEVIDKPQFPIKKIKPSRLITGIIVSFIFTTLCLLVLLIRFSMSRALQSN